MFVVSTGRHRCLFFKGRFGGNLGNAICLHKKHSDVLLNQLSFINTESKKLGIN